jgi:hypothetical protein
MIVGVAHGTPPPLSPHPLFPPRTPLCSRRFPNGWAGSPAFDTCTLYVSSVKVTSNVNSYA